MLIDVKIPPLAESVTEATLGSWLKKQGDSVTEGEPIIEIETDKVILEITAPASGKLVEVLKNENDIVPSNEVIGRIDDSQKNDADSSTKGVSNTSAAAEDAGKKTESSSAKTATQTEKDKADQDKTEKGQEANSRETAGRSKTSPAVRKLISESDIQQEQIAPTGKGGRITKQDVIAAQQKEKSASARSGESSKQVARNERVPMSALRRRIAERLVGAQHDYAMLTTFNEVNMSRVLDLRARYKQSFEKTHGVKLGFMSFFVLASVEALREFPIINASIDDREIVYHSFIDIGIAVSAPKGLVVPVVRDADQKTMAQIEKEINQYADKASNGTLTIDEMSGGTFTITNGGVFGSMMSTPIINPPQSAILGMHSIQERAVVEQGQIVARPMMYLALTYDHRIIDGREAVLFLRSIKEVIEDPTRLLLHV